MKKALLVLVLGIFMLSSLSSIVSAAKTPGSVDVQFGKGSGGQYIFTITNNGVKGIFHFQVNFAVLNGTTVTLDTAIANWSGAAQVAPDGISAVVGLTANAHKYYLKSSGQNSITIKFTISPAPASVSGQWSANYGSDIATGTLPPV